MQNLLLIIFLFIFFIKKTYFDFSIFNFNIEFEEILYIFFYIINFRII